MAWRAMESAACAESAASFSPARSAAGKRAPSAMLPVRARPALRGRSKTSAEPEGI